MPDSSDLGALPEPRASEDEEYARLLAARRQAVAAIMDAEQIEREASAARRKAARLTKTYERLLLEWHGQQRLL